MHIPFPLALVLLLVAGFFAYHFVIGWRTEIVRFPMQLLVYEEFERERSAANYWFVMVLDALCGSAALSFAVFGLVKGSWQ